MRKVFEGCLILGMILLLSGCRSGGDKKQSPPKGFMEGDPARTEPASKSYFAREREKRRQYEREYKDVRRPMNQDHFKVMPWKGKYYTPRSESLHDSSREPDSSLYYRF